MHRAASHGGRPSWVRRRQKQRGRSNRVEGEHEDIRDPIENRDLERSRRRARPKSIRKVTRPVSATAPPGRRPRIMIHLAKPREPSSAIKVSAGSGGPISKTVEAAAAAM